MVVNCSLKTQGDEDLRAVGDEALDDAGGGVEDGGDADGFGLELVGAFLGDGARDDDGDGVVGREAVDGGDEEEDAEFAGAGAADDFGDAVGEPEDAAVGLDGLEESAGEEGDDQGFAHAEGAFAEEVHGVEEAEFAEGAADEGG